MPTLLEKIHALAEDVGEYGSYATTALGTTTTLICSTLVNTNLSSTEFAGMSVLCESGNNAGEVRYVTSAGLNKSTGTLTVTAAFTNAVASSVTFSMYSHLPPFRQLNRPGYREIINKAERKMWVRDSVSFSGTSDLKHYPVSRTTYPWWTDEGRIIEVRNPLTNADDVHSSLPFASWDWDADSETQSLVLPGAPFKTGETFTVRVYRPGNSRIKPASTGIWTDQTSQTAGLVALGDESLPDVEDVVTIARPLFFRAMADLRAPGSEKDEWMLKMRACLPSARRLLQEMLPKDRSANVHKFRPVMAYQR